MKMEAELVKRVKELEGDREVLAAEREKLNAKLVRNFNKIKKAKEELLAVRMTASKGKVDWALLMEFDAAETTYKPLMEAILKASPGYHVAFAGYSPKTLQYAPRLMLNEASEGILESIEQLLREIMPHVKPIGGVKLLKIMDPGLSQYASWYLHVYDDRIELTNEYGHDRKPRFTAKGMLEMLRYVQQHLAFGNEAAEEDTHDCSCH